MHELSTLNLIYMYDVKLKYFYIKHVFFNAFTALVRAPYYTILQGKYVNLTSHLSIKFNVWVSLKTWNTSTFKEIFLQCN